MTNRERMLNLLRDETIIFVDYYPAAECENPDTYYTCLKCGKCGRKFDHGIMVDDGGTHLAEEED